MISLLFISLAAVFKAVADTLAHHFDISVFRDKPRKYWDPNIITKTGPKIFGYPIDAWHISNSFQILSWFGFGLTYRATLEHWWLDLAAGGICFNLIFSLFYNKILRK